MAAVGGTRVRTTPPTSITSPTPGNIGKFDSPHAGMGRFEESRKNLRRFADLQHQTYGNTGCRRGKSTSGTNTGPDTSKRSSRQRRSRCLLAFQPKKTATSYGQHSSEKLITGRVHDWPLQKASVVPLGRRPNGLWFVTSRGESPLRRYRRFYDDEDDGSFKTNPSACRPQ